MGRCALAAALFSTLFAFVACGHDAALDQPANACVNGQTVSCACKDGSASYQRCEASGVFGACQCDDSGASSTSGSNPMSAPDASTTANGGSQSSSAGTQGSGATGGASGAAGTAGSPVHTPTAGTGAGGSGGSAGALANAGAGGTSGSAGSAGANAGSGGSAGSGAGTGGVAPVPEPGVPMAGTAYGRCMANDLCHDGLVCVASWQNTNFEGYCAPECVTPDGGTSDCPQPTSGGVNAVCLAFAGVCALTACGEDACPHGMECAGRMGQGNQQGSCQYPAR